MKVFQVPGGRLAEIYGTKRGIFIYFQKIGGLNKALYEVIEENNIIV